MGKKGVDVKNIIRAWKDPIYRATLENTPDNPAGMIELTGTELDQVGGGWGGGGGSGKGSGKSGKGSGKGSGSGGGRSANHHGSNGGSGKGSGKSGKCH